MCDYSLEYVANRPAKVGDKLVTTKFTNSITRGFTEVGEPNVAVCLMPGTELAFDRDVECVQALGLLPSRKIRERVARFREINVENLHEHHDALEFPNGQIVLLTRLIEGQVATVLQLPAHPQDKPIGASEATKRRTAGDVRGLTTRTTTSSTSTMKSRRHGAALSCERRREISNASSRSTLSCRIDCSTRSSLFRRVSRTCEPFW